MDLLNGKYIIVEIIPTSLNPDKGTIVQLSALKLNGLKLMDRFDFRLKEEMVPYKQFLDIINYDKDAFTYVGSKEEMLRKFKKWSNKLPILIIDNLYTENYLSSLPNNIESILPYFKMEYSEDVIDRIISKYGLEYSNYIVDILYDALIKEL